MLLWICIFAIATGPIIFLRFDLWPSFKMCSSHSTGRALEAARFKQGCTVALMSFCRILHIALIISVSFDAKAPTYACVEFSFNRRSDGVVSYSTPLLEVIQGVFYPIFLLAGKKKDTNVHRLLPNIFKSTAAIFFERLPLLIFPVLARQEWFDAELRHTGILIHANDSRRHMIVCFIIRRLLAAVAFVFLFGQIIMLIIISIKKEATDPTPTSLSVWMRTSQICCAFLVIFIQLYHWKASMGVAALHDIEVDTEEEEVLRDPLVEMEDGQKDQQKLQLQDKISPQDGRELSYSEIVTGDRSNCGYSSHQQRTETYHVGNIEDNDDDSEMKADVDELSMNGDKGVINAKNSAKADPNRRRSSRLSMHKRLESERNAGISRDNIERPHTQNDLASLLSENHHAQLTAPHYPIVTDHYTSIIVMAACVCFLITSIPASLRSYVSAFLLYSLTSRVLEIAAASLLLSPFKIQNSSLRRRLAAKIMEGSALCTGTSGATTVLCPRDANNVLVPGERNAASYKAKGRYAGVMGTDNSPSSLTVSIMHKASNASTSLRDNIANDSRQKGQTFEALNSSKNLKSSGTNIAHSGEKMTTNETSDKIRLAALAELGISEAVTKRNDEKEAPGDQPTVKAELSNGTGDAWVDRWASKIMATSHRRQESSYEPLDVDATPVALITGEKSSTSSVTAATDVNLYKKQRKQISESHISSRRPPSVSSSSKCQKEKYAKIGNDSKDPNNAEMRQSSRDFSKWTKAALPQEKRRPEDSTGIASTKSEDPAAQSVKGTEPGKTESPRSIVNCSSPLSPLTASVITLSKQNVIDVAATPVTTKLTMKCSRPQIENEIGYGNHMDKADTMSIDTKKSKGNRESYKSKMDEEITSQGSRIHAISHPQNTYYEKWTTSLSQPQQSKLTRRPPKTNSNEERSPRSPRTPDINCYDGDAEKEKSYTTKIIKTPSQSSGSMSGSRVLLSTLAPLGGSQILVHNNSAILSPDASNRSVDKESLIQSSKGLTTTQPVPAPELRYFMKKV